MHVHDLIYTRCGSGIDLKTGAVSHGDGYQFWCSSPWWQENYESVDIESVQDLVVSPQYFDDPLPRNMPEGTGFMEDAYIYCVQGDSVPYICDFHPVPYDLSVTGDFPKRPGLHLSQVVPWEEDRHPYEAIGDNRIWTAKASNEAYYYENAPEKLPDREVEPSPMITQAMVSAFIDDGRREALAKSVAFIIGEMSKLMENRKYLLVYDTQESIALWIAAIERALPVSVSRRIPFATRLKAYGIRNNIAVDARGRMAAQGNASGCALRALIVGLPTEDPSSAFSDDADMPYRVLDGTAKSALLEAPSSSPFLSVAVSSGRVHDMLCNGLLESIEMPMNLEELDELASSLDVIENRSSNMKLCSGAFAKLAGYEFSDTQMTRYLYATANDMLPEMVASGMETALPVIGWITRTAKTLGDSAYEERVNGILRSYAIDSFFEKYSKGSFERIWEEREYTGDTIAALLADKESIIKYSQRISGYSSGDAALFFKIYRTVCDDVASSDAFGAVTAYCVFSCLNHCESEADLISIVEGLTEELGAKAIPFMMSCLASFYRAGAPAALSAIASYAQATGNARLMLSCADALGKNGQTGEQIALIRGFIERARGTEAQVNLAYMLADATFLQPSALAGYYELMDSSVDIDSGSDDDLAYAIQDSKPDNTVCTRSAHIVGASEIAKADGRLTIDDIAEPYRRQGFPSSEAAGLASYAGWLGKSLAAAGARLGASATEDCLYFLLDIDPRYTKPYMSEALSIASKGSQIWAWTIEFIADIQDRDATDELVDAAVNAMAESGMQRRDLEKLGKSMPKRCRAMLSDMIDDALGTRGERKPGFHFPLFGRR